MVRSSAVTPLIFSIDQLSKKDQIWKGVKEGERNEALSSIVGQLIANGICNPVISEIAKMWNRRCSPPEEEAVLTKHVLNLIRDFGRCDGQFWSVRSTEGEYVVQVDLDKFIKFLQNEGFTKFYLGEGLRFRKDSREYCEGIFFSNDQG